MSMFWQDKAWDDWLYFLDHNENAVNQIILLLDDIQQNGYNCIGKPEPLKGLLSGKWSVRIDDVNRLIFEKKDDVIEIISCRGHYDDH